LGYAAPANVYVPESSIENPADAGVSMHTDYVLLGAPASGGTPKPQNGETPASLGCVYGVGPKYSGCKKPGGKQQPKGGWGAIALVDAYDNPDAATDIVTFSKQFGLPAANFQKVYANGNGHCGTPTADKGWSVESSLDIEWAHAMAPNAKIILVEACTNSNTDLYYAEFVASGLVAAAGGGDISNSWGGGEYGGETADDYYFFFNNYSTLPVQVPNITYFASAGDSGCGAGYPSSSPWVVSAGGTAVNRNSNGTFANESCWAGSGGGSSSQEVWSNTFTSGNTGAWADYQYPIFGFASRQTPDYAFDADPNTGVDFYSQYGYGGWGIVGGTSVASPALAGITNLAGQKLGSYFLPPVDPSGYYTNEEDNLLYAQLPAARAYGNNFYDITTGGNGCFVGKSWDYCTGVGSPRGLTAK
jgi:subtilase family serine protease